MSLNRVQLIGNLTRDPEMKQIPGGQVVTSFGVATNFTWTSKTGEKQNKTEFHNIVVWGKLAEICGQYLRKGSKAYVEGRLQTREWEGEDGVKRYRTEIIADNMIMLDRKGGDGSGDFGAEREARGIAKKTDNDFGGMEAGGSSGGSEEEVKIDDLPF